MARPTAQIGAAQVGQMQVGAGGTTTPTPPLDPSFQPWEVALGPVQVAPWRPTTLESFARGPELPQPPLNPLTIPFYVASTREQEVTPPQRYRTLESVAIPVFPQTFPASQIQIFAGGINHRHIGGLTVTGGAQQLQAFIRHVDRSGTFLCLSARIMRQLNTTGTCEAKFAVPSGGFTPVIGDSLQIIEFNRTLFSGFIDRRKYTVYPGTTTREYTVQAVDWNGLLQRRLVTKDYTAATLEAIVSDIVLFFLQSEGITVQIDSSIAVADDFSFKYIKLSDAFNQLAQVTNTIWWIDNYKVLRFIHAASATASAFFVDETGAKQAADIFVEDSLQNYRNVQYVRTPQNILSETVTVTDSHTFTGAAADIVCPTRYPLTSQPQSVLENSIEIVGTDRLFELVVGGTTTYPSGGEGYYWAKQFSGIFHWPSNSPPTAGTTLDVTYTGVSTYAGNVVVYRDTAEIANMAAATGGSGIFEEIEDYSGDITYAQALALATGIEQATAPVPTIMEWSTIEQFEDLGYAVSVNLPRWGVNQTLVIQQVSMSSEAVDLGKGTTFRTNMQLVSARTLGNWTQWYERLLARLNKFPISPPTEKPTWALAFDTPGNVSSGLAVGAFGAPWSVETGQGRILYVSAVFNDGADADIKIDIFLNGISIFDSTKLVYPSGTAGSTILYTNLAPGQVNVKQKDLLTLSVLQCGLISPGKNGTITVVIGQR